MQARNDKSQWRTTGFCVSNVAQAAQNIESNCIEDCQTMPVQLKLSHGFSHADNIRSRLGFGKHQKHTQNQRKTPISKILSNFANIPLASWTPKRKIDDVRAG